MDNLTIVCVLQSQLAIKEAKLKAQKQYSMNMDVAHIQASIIQAEIDELKKQISKWKK